MKTAANSNKQKKVTFFSRWYVIIGGAALLVLLTFGVYELGRHEQKWGETNELRTIKSESLASTNLLGLELVEAEQMGQGSLIGKTISPNVTRTFKVRNGDVEATKKLIIDYAEKEGWVYDPTYPDEDAWRAHKTSGDFELTMIVRKSLRYENSVEIVIF